VSFFAGQELPAATVERMANPPRARALGNAIQAIPTGTFTALRFPEQVYLYQIGHDPVTNPTFFAAQVAGLYELKGSVYLATNATGSRALKFQKNGVDIAGSGDNRPAQTGVQTSIRTTVEVELAASDFVTLMVFQGSGGNLDTYVAVDYARPSMSIKLIRDNSL
jgi:hypothetical protein